MFRCEEDSLGQGEVRLVHGRMVHSRSVIMGIEYDLMVTAPFCLLLPIRNLARNIMPSPIDIK